MGRQTRRCAAKIDRNRTRGNRLKVVAAAVCASASWATAQTPPPLGYNIKTLSLSGPGYEYTDSQGLHRFSDGGAIAGSAGLVVGTTSRLAANGIGLGEDVWLFDGASTHVVNPTGGEYSYTTPNGVYRDGSNVSGNAAGNLALAARRYSATGDLLGSDVLRYSGAVGVPVSLTGVGYEQVTANGNVRWARSYGISDAGTVVGGQARYRADGASLGNDVWVYNGAATQVVGLTGGLYEYTAAGGGTYRNSSIDTDWGLGFIRSSGKGFGYSQRYSTSGADLGKDHWYYNGSTTTLLGLTGAAHEYTDADGTHRNSDYVRINSSGKVVGLNLRYAADGSDLGEDAWYYDGATTQQLGYTGGIYEYNPAVGVYRDSYIDGQGTGGHVTGSSLRFGADGSDLGADSWIYHGGQYVQTGLFGPGYEYTTPAGVAHASGNAEHVNSAGHALGNTLRYASDGTWLGRDTWVYDGTQSTRVSLSGPGYEYSVAGGLYRDSDGGHILTESGKAGGHSSRYASNGTSLGNDVFVFDGIATRRVNLVGGVYDKSTADGISRDAFLSDIDDDLDIAWGTSGRFAPNGSSLGQAGFYFDLDTQQVTPLEFSLRADGYCYTDPQLLTDDGVMFGIYRLFSGNTDLGRRAFWWSEQAGFYDLGSLVNGGLAGNGWDALYNVISASGSGPGGSPSMIVGWGLGPNQVPDNGTIFGLAAQTPEPAAAGLMMLVGATWMLRRTRRVTRR